MSNFRESAHAWAIGHARKAKRDKFCRKRSGAIGHLPTKLQHRLWCVKQRDRFRIRVQSVLSTRVGRKVFNLRFRLGLRIAPYPFVATVQADWTPTVKVGLAGGENYSVEHEDVVFPTCEPRAMLPMVVYPGVNSTTTLWEFSVDRVTRHKDNTGVWRLSTDNRIVSDSVYESNILVLMRRSMSMWISYTASHNCTDDTSRSGYERRSHEKIEYFIPSSADASTVVDLLNWPGPTVSAWCKRCASGSTAVLRCASSFTAETLATTLFRNSAGLMVRLPVFRISGRPSGSSREHNRRVRRGVKPWGDKAIVIDGEWYSVRIWEYDPTFLGGGTKKEILESTLLVGWN